MVSKINVSGALHQKYPREKEFPNGFFFFFFIPSFKNKNRIFEELQTWHTQSSGTEQGESQLLECFFVFVTLKISAIFLMLSFENT